MRLTSLAVFVLVAGFSLTGCGGEPETSTVASGGGPQAGSSSSPSAGSSLSREEKGVKFAQCLREHGLDVPDPEPGKGIQLKVGPESGMSREEVDKAMKACQQFNPQGEAGPNPQQEENGRKFAACMRENGVEKFPDPKPGQRGIMINREAGEDPDLEKAQQACQPILQGGR